MAVSVPVTAVRALARASRILERASGELNLSQYRVLSSVATGDERATRIADRLALGKPAITAAVESLRQRGLLTRSGVAEDQRAAALALTAEGRAALDEVEHAMRERLRDLAGRTPDPAAFVQALVWLDGAIDGFIADRGASGGSR